MSEYRRGAYERLIAGYKREEIGHVDIERHRYVAAEKKRGKWYLTGHATLREACVALSESPRTSEPQWIFDLDRQERLELEDHYMVTPVKSEAVVIAVPKHEASYLHQYLKLGERAGMAWHELRWTLDELAVALRS